MILQDDSEMVQWADFAPEVIVALKDVPQDMAENYIRQSAIDLAERSQVLIREVDILMQGCVTEYPIDLPTCERVVSIQQVCANQTNACACKPSVRVSTSARCAVNTGIGMTTVWFSQAPDRMHVENAIDGTTIRLRVAVAPRRDSCEVAKLFYEVYHEAVVDGALARLLKIKSASWYDPQLSMSYKADATAGITASGIDRLTGGVRGPFPMRGRRII
jgi:hypothetical protein